MGICYLGDVLCDFSTIYRKLQEEMPAAQHPEFQLEEMVEEDFNIELKTNLSSADEWDNRIKQIRYA